MQAIWKRVGDGPPPLCAGAQGPRKVRPAAAPRRRKERRSRRAAPPVPAGPRRAREGGRGRWGCRMADLSLPEPGEDPAGRSVLVGGRGVRRRAVQAVDFTVEERGAGKQRGGGGGEIAGPDCPRDDGVVGNVDGGA